MVTGRAGRRHERSDAHARSREPDQALRRPDRGQEHQLSIAAGEILGLIGPNGSGKSTAMKSIMGVERPTAGRCASTAPRSPGWPPHRIARLGVGMVFQHSRPLHRQTVLENIMLGAAAGQPVHAVRRPALIEARARDIAERVGLGARDRPAPADAAVRRSAPDRTRQGDRARSQGGAGRRALRRPHRARSRGLRRTDRRDAATKAARC